MGAVAALLIALGGVALAARPVGIGTIAVTAAVGAAGVLAPVPARRRGDGSAPMADRWSRAGVLAVGVAAFLAARSASVGPSWPGGWEVAAAAVVAAVAEEAFFRRLVYGWLVRSGAPVAVVGSAVAFALVHVPAYGLPALPVDLAAGLVLGWQRWGSGRWSVPAATHAVANLIQLW